LDSVSVDADFPSSFEGGILSRNSTLSSVRDIPPSVPQVFISREKPEMISALFASHSSSTQADSSPTVVVGSQVSHLDSVQLTQSATVELSPVTRKQFLFDSDACSHQSQPFVGCAPPVSHSTTAVGSLSNSISLNSKDLSTFSNIINLNTNQYWNLRFY
jgi:hypothetical protein